MVTRVIGRKAIPRSPDSSLSSKGILSTLFDIYQDGLELANNHDDDDDDDIDEDDNNDDDDDNDDDDGTFSRAIAGREYMRVHVYVCNSRGSN